MPFIVPPVVTGIHQLIADYWKQSKCVDFAPPAALAMAPATLADIEAQLGTEGRFLSGLEPPVEGNVKKLWGLPIVLDLDVPLGEVNIKSASLPRPL